MNKPIIIPCSCKLRNDEYAPQVILRFIDGPKITERPLYWDKEFNTKEEADKYAILQAEIHLRSKYKTNQTKG